MTRLVHVLLIAIFICVATETAAFTPIRAADEDALGNYEEKESPRPFLNEVSHTIDDISADNDMYNPLILRHVEASLRDMANTVKAKRMLICSKRPRPSCEMIG